MSDERVQALLRELERELAGTGRTVLDVARAYEAPRRRDRVGLFGLPVERIRSTPGAGVYTFTRPLILELEKVEIVPDPEGLGRMVIRLPGGGLVTTTRLPLESVRPPRGTRARTAGHLRALRRSVRKRGLSAEAEVRQDRRWPPRPPA